MRRRLVLTVAAAVTVVLTACSSGGNGSPITTSPRPTTAATAATARPGSTGAGPATTAPPGTGAVPQGFPGIVALLTDPAGTVHEWCLLLAANDADRGRGLMDVDSLGGYDGMVFRFEGETTAGFYMFHTRLPLSIAWYAKDGSFVSSTDMAPCPASRSSSCQVYRATGPYTDAIEVEQGNLGRLGAVSGSKLALGGTCSR